MRVPVLHRFLGLAGIYAQLESQAAALRSQGAAIGAERARNDRQDKDMATLAENASKLLAAETALEGEFTTLEAAYTALKNAPVQVGETATPETVAAIQQATDAFEALSAKMASAAGSPVTSEPTGDAPSEPDAKPVAGETVADAVPSTSA